MYCDDNILSHVMLLVLQACSTEHGMLEQVSWA
jgi:hypothetical protein